MSAAPPDDNEHCRKRRSLLYADTEPEMYKLIKQLQDQRSSVVKEAEAEEQRRKWYQDQIEQLTDELEEINPLLSPTRYVEKQRATSAVRDRLTEELGSCEQIAARHHGRMERIQLLEKHMMRLKHSHGSKIKADKRDSGTCDHLEAERGGIVVVDAATNTQSPNNNVRFSDQPDILTSTTHQPILPAHNSSSPNYDVLSIGERIREGLWSRSHLSLINHAAASQIESCSPSRFHCSSSRQDSLHETPTALQLTKKLGMMYSLLEMFRDVDNISQKLRTMSLLPEECIIMRQSGYVPLLVHLIYSDNSNPSRSSIEARNHAAAALRNIISSNCDSEQAKREMQVLRLLDRIRAHCDKIRLQLAAPNSVQEGQDINYRPGEAATWLKDKSFKEDYQPVICLLGGLQALADLLYLDYSLLGLTEEPYHLTLRSHVCMALTNLTFRRGANKSLLCSMRPTMLALVDQLNSSNEALQQAAASVLRNLSWHADLTSKQTLHDVRVVPLLMKAAMRVECESALRQILSALWNLSSHCHENKADICKTDGAIGFLVGLLTFKSISMEFAINESSGGILMNVSSLISESESLRQIIRDRDCLQVLVKQLTSESLTIVGNACYTLWNLSARCEHDQKTLFMLKADQLLERLTQSKHEKIREGSSGALKNLRKFQPNKKAFRPISSSSRPSLLARKQKQFAEDLDLSLQETCDNIESPTEICPTEQLGHNANNYLARINKSEISSLSCNLASYDESVIDTSMPPTSGDEATSAGKGQKKRLVYVEPNFIPVMPISRQVDQGERFNDEPIDYSTQCPANINDTIEVQPIDYSTRCKEQEAVSVSKSQAIVAVNASRISKASSLTNLPKSVANLSKLTKSLELQKCGLGALECNSHSANWPSIPHLLPAPASNSEGPHNASPRTSQAGGAGGNKSFRGCTAFADCNNAHNSSACPNQGAKSVTWDPNIESPIMLSRCNSFGSLSSFDNSSLHNEITSQHSGRRFSEANSQFDVPEPASARHSTPSNPKAASPASASHMNRAGELTAIEMSSSANQQDLELDMIGRSTLDEVQNYAREESTHSSTIGPNPEMELKAQENELATDACIYDGEQKGLKTFSLEDLSEGPSYASLSVLNVDCRDQAALSSSHLPDKNILKEENNKIIKATLPEENEFSKNSSEHVPDTAAANNLEQSKFLIPQSCILSQPYAKVAISGSWLSAESKRFAVSTPKNGALAQRALHFCEIQDKSEEQPLSHVGKASPYSLTQPSPVQFLDRGKESEDNTEDGFRLLEEDEYEDLGFPEILPFQQNCRFVEELEISPSVEIVDVHGAEDEMLHFSVEDSPLSYSTHSSISELSVESITSSEKNPLAQYIRSALPKKLASSRKNKIAIPRSTLCYAPDVSPERIPKDQRSLNAMNPETAEINVNLVQQINAATDEGKLSKFICDDKSSRKSDSSVQMNDQSQEDEAFIDQGSDQTGATKQEVLEYRVDEEGMEEEALEVKTSEIGDPKLKEAKNEPEDVGAEQGLKRTARVLKPTDLTVSSSTEADTSSIRGNRKSLTGRISKKTSLLTGSVSTLAKSPAGKESPRSSHSKQCDVTPSRSKETSKRQSSSSKFYVPKPATNTSNTSAVKSSVIQSSPKPSVVSSPKSSANSSTRSSANSSTKSSAISSTKSSANSSTKSSANSSTRPLANSSTKFYKENSPKSTKVSSLKSPIVSSRKGESNISGHTSTASANAATMGSPQKAAKITAPRLVAKSSIPSLRPPKITPTSTCKSRQAANPPKVASTAANLPLQSFNSAADASLPQLSSTQSASAPSTGSKCPAKAEKSLSGSPISTLSKPGTKKTSLRTTSKTALPKSVPLVKSSAPCLIPKSSVPFTKSRLHNSKKRLEISPPAPILQDAIPAPSSSPECPLPDSSQWESSCSSSPSAASAMSLLPSFSSSDSINDVPEIRSLHSESLSLKSESLSVQSDTPTRMKQPTQEAPLNSKTSCSVSAIDSKTKNSLKKHAVSRIASLWKKEPKKKEQAQCVKNHDGSSSHQEDKKSKKAPIFRVTKSRPKNSVKPPDPPIQSKAQCVEDEECSDSTMKRRTYTIDLDKLPEKEESEIWLGKDGSVESIAASPVTDVEDIGCSSSQEMFVKSPTTQPPTKTEMLLARRRQRAKEAANH